MNIPRGVPAFLAGAVLAAAAWLVGWPEQEAEPPKVAAPRHCVHRPAAPSSAELESWLRELESAPDAAAKSEAAEKIGRLPASAFPAALDGVELVRNHSLTLPARALLARWAALDGEAAVEWAWQRLRVTARWNRAFEEIVAAWAWSRPEELAEWARQHADPASRDLTLADAENREKPPVGNDELRRIAQALLKVDLRLAFEVLQLRSGWSSDDSRVISSLHSVDQVREALLAFDGLEEMDPYRSSGGNEILARALLQRWSSLDGADFRRSPHAHLIPDQPKPRAADLEPAVEQHLEWHREFQVWQSEESAAAPDMTGWSDAKREAWEDFALLWSGPSAPLSAGSR